MTARDVMTYLETLHVRLALTPEGQLHCKAPRGVLTLVLQGTLKTCKGPLTHLLRTGEDMPLPTGARLPETDYSRFRSWQTGKVLATGSGLVARLAAPAYHDVPSPVPTVLGPPCPKKGCRPTTTFPSGHPASRYYRRTRLCVACYARLKNHRPTKERSTTDGSNVPPVLGLSAGEDPRAREREGYARPTVETTRGQDWAGTPLDATPTPA